MEKDKRYVAKLNEIVVKIKPTKVVIAPAKDTCLYVNFLNTGPFAKPGIYKFHL